jgi:hypothetical protein
MVHFTTDALSSRSAVDCVDLALSLPELSRRKGRRDSVLAIAAVLSRFSFGREPPPANGTPPRRRHTCGGTFQSQCRCRNGSPAESTGRIHCKSRRWKDGSLRCSLQTLRLRSEQEISGARFYLRRPSDNVGTPQIYCRSPWAGVRPSRLHRFRQWTRAAQIGVKRFRTSST